MAINPYNKTRWYDRIVDLTSGQVLQEGTRFNQARANNIEDGIYNAYEYLLDLESAVRRMQAQMEIDGRVPGNSGSFYDTFDGTSTRIALQKELTDVTSAVAAGATTIPVADGSLFKALTYVTIFDGQNYENVRVAGVDGNTLTVSALSNAYVKGAKVARSMVTVDTNSKTMKVAPFTVYNVELVEVV